MDSCAAIKRTTKIHKPIKSKQLKGKKREEKVGREGRERGNPINIFPFSSKCRAACEHDKIGVKSAFILEGTKHQTTNPTLAEGQRGKQSLEKGHQMQRDQQRFLAQSS